MKKFCSILLALILMLCLSACNQPDSPLAAEFTFPEGTRVAGMDISGETRESAWSKLEAAADSYTLDLDVDGNPVHISGKDIALTCSYEKFTAGADALEAGEAADFSRVISFSDAKLRLLLGRRLNKPVVDAAIVYDEAAGQFKLEPHTQGLKVDQNALTPMLKDTIRALAPQKSVEGVAEVLIPTWLADAPEAQAVLEQVNGMLGVKLAYTFSTSSTGKAHEIPAETILSFVDLGADGFTPGVKQDVLDAYVTELSNLYSITDASAPFQTTGGSTINLTISYPGLYVDTAGLAKDIEKCMLNGTSGTRTAPFLDSGIRDIAYGGTYIEINLNAQHLWFYKKGELLVSTPFVSGSVAADCCTPTGVYEIYGKSSNLYLVGPTWRDYVSYWMPFYRGYGLHDATWRDTFGGDIYLYEGSHGCINLPLDAAGIIYNNAPVGTKVILYGGVRSVPPLEQELTGTTSYQVAQDEKSFKLDITPKYESTKLSYSSDNTDVVTVSKDGTVTIKGLGTANITVSVPEYSFYTGAEITVTVSVHSPCQEGRHNMGQPEVTEPASCQPGLQRSSCTLCDYWEDSVLDPVQSHSFDEWSTVKEPTCAEDGAKERTCTLCQEETETEAIPKIPHPFDGSSACPVCGEENPDYTEETTAAE